jgi:hypothetical protein
MTERKTRTAARAAMMAAGGGQIKASNRKRLRDNAEHVEPPPITTRSRLSERLREVRTGATSSKRVRIDKATFCDLAALADILCAADSGFVLSQTPGHDWSELTRKSCTCYGAWYCRNAFNALVQQQQDTVDELNADGSGDSRSTDSASTSSSSGSGSSRPT